jgi:hypothetical protein
MLDKRVIAVPWWYGGYSTAPVVNCSEPNLGKGCTDPGTNCGNVKCAMDNQVIVHQVHHEQSTSTHHSTTILPMLTRATGLKVPYWGALGMDWLAAGGTKQDNLAAWSTLQKGHTNALVHGSHSCKPRSVPMPKVYSCNSSLPCLPLV